MSGSCTGEKAMDHTIITYHFMHRERYKPGLHTIMRDILKMCIGNIAAGRLLAILSSA